MQIVAERGIQPSRLRQWRTVLMDGSPQQRPANAPGSAPTNPVASPSDQAAEIARLRRELDRTRMERDVRSRFRRSGYRFGGRNLRQDKSLGGRSAGLPTQVCREKAIGLFAQMPK